MQKGHKRAAVREFILFTATALIAIAYGALFLIAPIWQVPEAKANYASPSTLKMDPSGAVYPESQIDVNTASAEELQSLPGLGPVKAAAIVSYREKYGLFSSLDDLENVQGISARMIESWSGLAIAGAADTDIH